MPWGGARFARPIEGDLTVVPMRGWRRAMNFVEAGLPWVMPSPNMPTPATALVYPGQCLFEATNLSEGRGTTRPFEIVGAPFLDGYDWVAALAEMAREGAAAAGRALSAALVPADVSQVRRPIVRRRAAARDRPGRLSPLRDRDRAHRHARTGWRRPTSAGGREPYEFVADPPAIDLLTGGGDVRRAVDADGSLGELVATFAPFERAFAERRRPALLADYL